MKFHQAKSNTGREIYCSSKPEEDATRHVKLPETVHRDQRHKQRVRVSEIRSGAQV